MSDKGTHGNGDHPTEVVHVSERLERAMDVVERHLAGGSHVILDFVHCDFITVEGLEWLEEVLLRSQSQQTDVKFINLNPRLYKVFKVAHIDSLQKACGAPASTTGPVC